MTDLSLLDVIDTQIQFYVHVFVNLSRTGTLVQFNTMVTYKSLTLTQNSYMVGCQPII